MKTETIIEFPDPPEFLKNPWTPGQEPLFMGIRAYSSCPFHLVDAKIINIVNSGKSKNEKYTLKNQLKIWFRFKETGEDTEYSK